jgi:hypothetical protein
MSASPDQQAYTGENSGAIGASPPPGSGLTAVAGTTTLDALITAAFPTQSADLGAYAAYWTGPKEIRAFFPSGTTLSAKGCAKIKITFEGSAPAPTVLK